MTHRENRTALNGKAAYAAFHFPEELMGRGKLIVFEGIDGCGKGTQIELLSEALAQRGIDAKLTREPTGGEIGRLLRRCLLRIMRLHGCRVC